MRWRVRRSLDSKSFLREIAIMYGLCPGVSLYLINVLDELMHLGAMSVNALDVRPESAQALVDVLIAPVDLSDIVDYAGAFGR